MVETLLVERRREVFAALVALQDTGLSVAPSRQKVAVDYGLSAKQVEKIEKEGLECQWPPLGA
ncbi:hypothetical protein [Zavarzinella formosa]|uniref:hypothetical protein n=1 Tax=Zavarzinella formosa TaxID=360055 RepID=UPI0003075E03|nr:hypothetical protein [Zavarzinella formosa]